MAKTKDRLTLPPITTRQDMERAVGEYAAAANRRDSLAAELENALTAVRAKFEGRIDACVQAMEAQGIALRDWAERNPGEFGKLKSIATVHGTIGWRIGQPQLKPALKWTWDRVKERLETLGKEVRERYLRVKTEINKEALLADRESVDLSAFGVRVIQEEVFFVEPKREPVAGPEVKEAA